MPISNTKWNKGFLSNSICRWQTQFESGMTLLEILIALTLVAGIMSLTLPRLRSGDQAKAIIRKITVLARYVHSTSRLKGIPYRMVIELGQGSPNSLYVERGSTAVVSLKSNEEINPQGSPAPKSDFLLDKGILKKPMELPKGYQFDDVEFGSKQEKVTTGKAYVYFFPQGFATKAAIHISDGKDKKFTIAIHPLTGQSYAAQTYVALKDIQ